MRRKAEGQRDARRLLDIHDKYTDLVGTGPEKGCFQGHSIFHKAMKEAFEVFVNKVRARATRRWCGMTGLSTHPRAACIVRPIFMALAIMHASLQDIGKTSTAELLSNFCDNLLKKSGERLSDDALEDKLEKVVRLFCYLSDKVRHTGSCERRGD
jgi:cullin 1